jgi:hypothetical protein
MHLRTSLAVACCAMLPAALSAQAAAAPCFEPNYGTLLGTGDDTVFAASSLGFTFNYAGTGYTDIEVSSNGFVWLGANGNFNPRCCSGTGAGLTADPPSIAILWTDLVIDFNEGVYFNALPGRAVITWKNAREFGYANYFTLQMQLTANGEVTFWYSPTTVIVDAFHTAVAGISPGNGALDPGSTDLSTALPYSNGTELTFYEEWAGGAFDYSSRTWEWLPIGATGTLALERTACQFVPAAFTPYGNGCPPLSGNPYPEFYEIGPGTSFDLANTAIELIPAGQGYLVQPSAATWFGGYTNVMPHFDDSVVTVNLPFAFPHPGGTTNVVGQSSNGYIWLDGVTLFAPYFPDVFGFQNDPGRLLGLWTDLYVPGGGAIYSDQVNATTWAFTWVGVPEYPTTTNFVTFQIQIESTGRVVFLYQGINILNHDILVGYTRGNGILDPGNTDISAAMPFFTGNGTIPMELVQDSGGPVVGTTFNMRVQLQPPTSLATFLVLGFGQVAIPLDGLGMPGCSQYVTLDSPMFFPTTFPATICGLGLPNDNAFLGFNLYAQAANLAPTVNTFGVATSNGGQITIGAF